MSFNSIKSPYSLGNILFLFFLLSGTCFALFALVSSDLGYSLITTTLFPDSVGIPFQKIDFGELSFQITLDNFLIFQEFEAITPMKRIPESFLFAAVFFVTLVSILTLFSSLNKFYFIAAGIFWILLLTLGNFNGLNIVSPSANYSLLIVLTGGVLPMVLLHIWGQNLSFYLKWIIISLSLTGAVFLLIQLSPIIRPDLFLAEHTLVLAIGLSLFWMAWVGHGFISGIYILLSRINQNVGIRISWQIALISLIYILLLFSMLLDLTGEVNLPFPVFNPLFLVLPIGFFGWYSVDIKTKTDIEQPVSAWALKALYLMGFGLSIWLIWKLKVSGNQPAEEFVKHGLVYTQIGFSIFFLVYLFSNFLSIMDSGKAVDKVLFKPYSLPYYHLRIGSLMAIMVLTIYADGIVGVQANALSNNILADYYYETDQKLEASILYDNSWNRYRKNPKAKHTVAQLLFQLNQPTLAKQHLEQSFSEVPQVDNILLLADRLHLENKLFEAIFYLEEGLNRFPNNPFLKNNLALFYIKLNREEEAINLLDDSPNQTLNSNYLALSTKLGKSDTTHSLSNDLISLINRAGSIHYLGEKLPSNLKEDLISKSLSSETPLLTHVGLRNSWTEKDSSDPSIAHQLLDSLGKEEVYLDFLMQLQETASLRSLASGRITETVKNLNGLAFRNPGDAAYYLQLSSDILGSNLDFEKASIDLLAAIEKGFLAIEPYHLSFLKLGNQIAMADTLARKFDLQTPDYLNDDFIQTWRNFHRTLPEKLFSQWIQMDDLNTKVIFANRLLIHKSHGLPKSAINELVDFLANNSNANPALIEFGLDPDFQNQSSISKFMNYQNLGEELTGNPYLTPLILVAAERINDPLDQYEVLNAAAEFNKDPILWIRKIQSARRIGLGNYATAALMEMREWMSDQELEKLQLENF